MIQQGEVFWVQLPSARGSEPAGRRPGLVIQANPFNRSRLNTVVVAAITSNLKYAAMPGNVRLRRGEAGLPRPSVINVTQLATVDKQFLADRIGTISGRRYGEVADGLRVVLGLEG